VPTIRLNDPDPTVLDGRHIRASAFEAAQRELIGTLPPALTSPGSQRARALTIGAGYARLPGLLAEAGYDVTAVDPSAEATEVARRQSAVGENGVDHRVGHATDLADPDDRFDLVWCIDTLEVMPNPLDALTEIARVTRPDGTIVLDTLNDTVLSRVVYLGLFQRFRPSKIMPSERYRRQWLISPAALRTVCEQAGITVQKVVGYEPGSPLTLLRALIARKRGSIGDGELGERVRFRLSTSDHTPPVTYYGIATPSRGPAPARFA